MGKAVNYFEAERTYNERGELHLSEVVSGFVPVVLSALETRKARSFWDSDASWEAAYQANTAQQWRLLEDVTDRIINEIRATRNGQATPIQDRDPQLDPYGLDLVSMRDILLTQRAADGTNTATLLEQIRDNLVAGAPLEQEQLDALLQIVLLLTA